jgi:hypothetical protein
VAGVNLDLFSRRIARRTDPATSHLGAERYAREGLGKDQELLYRLIRDNPGHTSAELADLLIQRGEHWYRASRLPTKRVSELIDLGKVVVGGERRCRITRHTARTYYAK